MKIYNLFLRRVRITTTALVVSLTLLPAISSAASFGPELSLAEAEAIAVQGDAMLSGLNAKAEALDEASVADGQLPDPKARFTLFNFPTDTFDRKQEGITQLRFGFSQTVPRGDTLALRSKRTQARASAERLKTDDFTNKLQREVRTSWLETYYWINAEKVVLDNIDLFKQLVDITESQFAAGRRNQQDVIRAELESGLLEDRLTHIQQQQEQARSNLYRWIGSEALRELTKDLPALEELPPLLQIRNGLALHPALRMQDANIRTSQHSVSIAREAYKPAWTFNLDYGVRSGDNPDGTKRADFLAAGVSLDVPLFTDKRQDRRLAAAQRLESAAKYNFDDKLRDMETKLELNYSKWLRLGERLRRYQEKLIDQASENSVASLSAYQNDTSDFPTLMRAKITELNTKLKSLRLEIDYAKAQANLLYLVGEK